MGDKTLDAILEIAIEKEKDAFDFYIGLSKKIKAKDVKDTLGFLAGEEKRHLEFLEEYRDGSYGPGALRLTEVVNYKVAEHLEKPDIEKDMESKDVYLVAAHRELLSYNFYQSLAGLHPDGKVKDMLSRMANEELRHKEKVEYLYSNTAFPQTAGG
ncbi:MAG: ferritin family protein [Deltaproteobacteria bacterium]|nr:ferritin family protein [Deltaproteobacteria bacterium]